MSKCGMRDWPRTSLTAVRTVEGEDGKKEEKKEVKEVALKISPDPRYPASASTRRGRDEEDRDGR